MDRNELEALIERGEGPEIEFKRSTGTLKAAFQTLCAFLNGAGGTVAIGVDDKGNLVGQEVADRTLQEIAWARAELEPPAVVDLERVVLEKGREVIVLSVAPVPRLVPFTFRRIPYERFENTTREMPQARYQQLLLHRVQDVERWETAMADTVRLDDLDEARILEFVRAAQTAGNLGVQPAEDPATILGRLRLHRDGVLTRAAVALFLGDLHPDYPQCRLQMARFRGITKNEFLDQAPPIRGGAFRLFEEAQLFWRRHIPVAGRVPPDGGRRIDTPAIPFEALREILINALIHRDYSLAGSCVQIAIFDDRLEVWSPGLLPEGVTIDLLLGDHVSVLRNNLVAEAFFRAGMIEQWGRGTNRVAELCHQAHIPAPEFRQTGHFTVVTFRANLGQTDAIQVPLTPGELRAARLRAGWTQTQLADALDVSQAIVSQWERGKKPIPEEKNEALRALFKPERRI